MGELICLGIESTSHTFSVGLARTDGKILANSKSMLIPKLGSGFVPNEMFDHHVAVARKLVTEALKEARLTMTDISCVAFSQGMGIPNSLRVGASAARYLSLKYNKPLIGVNHAIAHIEIGKITTKAKDPVVVYLSGGNTQIIALDGVYRVFGETIDMPVGNAFDVLARALGMKMPGGPGIEKTAEHGKYVELPYTVKGMDLSFSGILTNAIKKYRDGASERDLSYSFQENCFTMLTEVTERALAHTGKKDVLLVGGVAANQRLQKMMSVMCKERGARFYVVDSKYAGDNGSMIAWTGLKIFMNGGKTELSSSRILQNWRVDKVELG